MAHQARIWSDPKTRAERVEVIEWFMGRKMDLDGPVLPLSEPTPKAVRDTATKQRPIAEEGAA